MSCEEVVGKTKAAIFTCPKQSTSQDDSSLSSCLLLQPSLLHPTSATTATTSDQIGSDRRDRCASVGDRGMSSRGCGLIGGKSMMPKPKPRPEPIEINVDLERILPPVEYCAAAIAAKTTV